MAQQEEQRTRANEERERTRAEQEDRRRLAAEYAAREAAVAQETARRAQDLERERLEMENSDEQERQKKNAGVSLPRMLLERLPRPQKRNGFSKKPQESRYEERRRARLRECAACLEQHDLSEVVQLGCAHWYGRDALQGAISTACAARRPFQCCAQTVLAQYIQGAVSEPQWRQYQELLEEMQEVNPVYCSRATCATFLPSRLAASPVRVCFRRGNTASQRFGARERLEVLPALQEHG
ncbi:hypothetical protein BST61_g8547 [Cercospora zeina]